MAQRVEVHLIDDVDGSIATETVAFSLDGVTYEVDVNDEHARDLRDALAPWIAAGRRVGGRRTSKIQALGNGTGDNAKIRAWALENGMEVSARGRVSSQIRDAYAKANQG